MKVNTWLPVFPGFYNTKYEPDEIYEVEDINNNRAQNGLTELPYDAIKFDYLEYERDVANNCCLYLAEELKQYVTAINFQIVSSPREYNFANDSIHCEVELSEGNVKEIKKRLFGCVPIFNAYIKERYSSCSGFISSYDNDGLLWLADIDNCLSHDHKLGAILNFIALNTIEEVEQRMYEFATEQTYLMAENYDEFTTMEHCANCGEFYDPKLRKGNVCTDCHERAKLDLDIIVCAHCGEEITNKWFVREFQHQLKHGLIKPDQIFCDTHALVCA